MAYLQPVLSQGGVTIHAHTTHIKLNESTQFFCDHSWHVFSPSCRTEDSMELAFELYYILLAPEPGAKFYSEDPSILTLPYNIKGLPTGFLCHMDYIWHQLLFIRSDLPAASPSHPYLRMD